MANDAADTRLCFLASRQLEAPLENAFHVCTRGGKMLGTLDGVVVDPRSHRARYLVVDSGRLLPDRRLIPLPAHLDLAHQALEVDDDIEPSACEKFHPSHFRRFTGDDDTSLTSSRRR